MKRAIRRLSTTLAAVTAIMMIGGPASAHYCTNASKSPDAGIQVLIDATTGEVVWASKGVVKRFEIGQIDPETGEGFHGLVGIDFDGDGSADASVYSGVGPDGSLPDGAVFNGPTCRGITAIWELENCHDAPVEEDHQH